MPVNFLTVEADSLAEETLRITNKGAGSLEWSFEQNGDFYTAIRDENELRLMLDTTNVGKFQGTIFISSNGGEVTVPVRAVVKAAAQPSTPPAAANFVDITGQWQSAGGVGVFTGPGPTYQYQSTTVMGVVVEQGTATVTGNNVTMQGYNTMVGQFTASLSVQGDMMSGTITTGMGTVPIAMQRTAGAGGGFMKQLTNLFGN